MAKKINPRWKSGRRRIYQQRFRALQLPCSICSRPIDYTQPYYIIDEQGRKHVNKWAFCIDERIPVSKWQQAGYNSAAECSDDYMNNLQPAHVICNARKGNKLNYKINEQEQPKQEQHKPVWVSGQW